MIYALAYTHVRINSYNILEVIRVSVKDMVALRLAELCRERGITFNTLATLSGVTPSTVYSIMDETRRDISLVTVKKLCDGLEITLGNFFSTPAFDALEQEIC